MHEIACAGNGQIDLMRIAADGSLQRLARKTVSASAHTLAFDSLTRHLWVVWSDRSGDAIQQFAQGP